MSTAPALNASNLAGRNLVQVALPCSDLDRSVAWYRDVLGLPLMFETNGMAFFQAGGLRLMLGEQRGVDEGVDFQPGGAALYFDAPDLPALGLALEAAGVEFVGDAEVLQRTDKGELQLRFFRDPDGNLLALMGVVAV
jgi:catechol 2,3-dioxygenase-like lactoylglutathione lyase family enzyme